MPESADNPVTPVPPVDASAAASIFNTETILDLMSPEPLGNDRFLAQSHFMGSPRVFGGQVLGQSLHAAGLTVEGRLPHSMHALFLLAGDINLPIEYEVERVRDGGSFTTRRVVAFQNGKRIFVMSASFQKTEQGLEHQEPASMGPDPSTLPSIPERWSASQGGARPYEPMPIDIRAAFEGDLYDTASSATTKRFWVRSPLALGDDVLAHQSLFAYVSDYGMLSTALQPHGVKLADPRLQIASLDHTIWFHRPFRMDEWLQFDFNSTNASGGRGLVLGQVRNAGGELVASLAQEGLIRLRD
jgi:acyl-CoA thioesterase-2